MSDGLAIVGSGRSNGAREMDDFYPTPKFAVRPLLEREKFEGTIWECACGKGDISETLIEYDYPVYSSDLVDRGYGDGGIDFLSYQGEKFDNIITNPPYKHALEFVEQAKILANKKIMFLMKTVFLESLSRYEMFMDKEFPLRTVYQFCRRVPIYKSGEEMSNSGLIAYAWFVWDKEYEGKPTIEWIPDFIYKPKPTFWDEL